MLHNISSCCNKKTNGKEGRRGKTRIHAVKEEGKRGKGRRGRGREKEEGRREEGGREGEGRRGRK